jgi:hypothetical protein
MTSLDTFASDTLLALRQSRFPTEKSPQNEPINIGHHYQGRRASVKLGV